MSKNTSLYYPTFVLSLSPVYTHQLLYSMTFSTFRRFDPLRYWLSLIIFCCLSSIYAQNNANCFHLSTPVMSAAPGDTVCVPLRAFELDNISSAQFVVFYESSALEYLKVDITSSVLPGLMTNNLFHPYPGELRFAWPSPTGNPYSFPDSSIFFYMCFRVKDNANGFFPFHIGEQFPTIYEVVQEETLGVPVRLPLVHQMGGIDTGNPAPNTLYLTDACVQDAPCNQSIGTISLNAAGGTAPYTYTWQGPNGFTGSGADLQNLASGLYQVTITDQTGAEIFCEIRVKPLNYFASADPVITPAFCGASNGCANLNFLGSNPPFTYQWSTGNNNTGSNCALPPGQHSVTVTNQLGCKTIYSIDIENDTTFSLNTDWAFIETCNGTADLEVTVFDAPGPFAYLWSNGASTAAIDQLEEGSYTVTVTNIPGGCTASSEFAVFDISTQSWAAELQEDCGQGVGSLFIQYNQAGNLSFPVLISWSDGTTHQRQGPAAPGILDSLIDVPSGHYAVTITDANGCELVLERTMNCFQPAPVPEGFNWCYIGADTDPSDNCTGVYARHFQAITSLNFSIQYPNGSALEEIKSLQLPGLSQASFTLNPAEQTLGMSWQHATPLSLPDDQLLFEVCLTPGFGQVEDELFFVQTPVPATLSTEDGPQIFLGRNGWVDYGMVNQPATMACKAQGVAADCAADGKAQILLGSCTPGEKLYGHYVVYYTSDSIVYFDDLSGLRFSDGGVYQINVYRPDLSQEYWFAAVPPIAPMEECVWPGDADNNQAVNHHDLLYIGLAYGKSGPSRTNASLNWTGQEAAGWAESSAVRQVNFKNIDTNGDGQINAADTLALVQNWGKVINTTRDNPFNAPLESSQSGQNPAISLQTDTLNPGDAVHLPLSVGSQSTPMENIYGLAFSISYDPEVVEDNIRFTPSASWFGNQGNYLCVQKNFPRQGRLDVAITRTDGVPVSGWGEIGEVFIIIEDNIFGIPAPDSIKNSKLFFSAISSSDAQESPKDLGAAPVDLVIKKSGSVHTQEPLERSIILAPNPAQDYLSIRSTASGIRELRLLRNDGGLQEIWHQGEPVSAVQKTVSHLPAGVYFVQIQTEDGVLVKKVMVDR